MKKRVESGWVEPQGFKFGLDRVGLRFFHKDVLSGWASFNPSTRNSFLSTFCMQIIKVRSERIFSAYFAWRFKLFPSVMCAPKAAKSLSNKVLRWAIFIVWMTPGQNLYCAHWSNNDGSPQDLCKMNFTAARLSSVTTQQQLLSQGVEKKRLLLCSVIFPLWPNSLHAKYAK